MVGTILTWTGVVLGIAVLLAMAFGVFVLDFHDALTYRRVRRHDVMPDHSAR